MSSRTPPNHPIGSSGALGTEVTGTEVTGIDSDDAEKQEPFDFAPTDLKPGFFGQAVSADDPTVVSSAISEQDMKKGHRDRLKKRFLRGGASAIEDYELLELLLFLAIPRRDVKPLAKKLINRFGSVAEVLSRPVSALKAAGLSDSVVAALKTVEAAALVLAKDDVLAKPVISSWQALLQYVRLAMARKDREQFRVLFLDKKNRLIGDEVQNEGTIDHTAVYPREIAKRALELSASAVILVHNHPSGDPQPSKGDFSMTTEIKDALSKLDIRVHDHIIVSRGGYSSFKSMGLM